MRVFRVVLTLGLFACVAQAGEILIGEEPIKDAEIVSVSATEVVYKVGGKEVTKKIAEVRKIDLRDASKIDAEKKYSQVDLTDGTTLAVSKWSIKGKDLQMTLLSGPEVTMSLDSVNGILNNAWDEKYRSDWRNRVINTRGKTAVVLKKVAKKTVGTGKDKKEDDDEDQFGKKRELIFNFECTIGEGDDKGEKIAVSYFEGKDLQKIELVQKDQHALIWSHKLPTQAPARICKLSDTTGNVIMVSKLEKKKDGVTVTTPSGAKLDFTLDQLSQIDYTTGRLSYLSDDDFLPSKTTITLDPFDKKDKLKDDYKVFVYRDTSLKHTPIKLGGTSYRRGLTLLPTVELDYDLDGKFRQFEAVVGIDEQTGAHGHVTLEVWGDNNKLQSIDVEFLPKTDKGQTILPVRKNTKVSLNVKDVKTLTLKLIPKDELNGLSIGVSLGDARVVR